MPKLKSKKKKGHKNKKPKDSSGSVPESTQNTTGASSESTLAVAPTHAPVIDIVVDKADESGGAIEQNVNTTVETPIVTSEPEKSTNVTVDSVNLNDSSTVAVTSTPASKKKRFSFLRKKDHSLSEIQVSSPDTSMDSKNGTLNNPVKRSSSLSHVDTKEHKSRIPRFHRSSKKKTNLSASCSHVESTSLVLNPGMDNWRMAGLLDTVEMSKSSHSVNASTTAENVSSPVAVVAAFREIDEVKETSNLEEIELSPTKQENEVPVSIETTTETVVITVENHSQPSPENKIKIEEKENTGTDGFVEANIDFEYSAEIHEKPPKIDLEKVTVKESDDDKDIGVHSPTMKDATNDAELYELENDERVVTIRKLEDIVRESKISLPKEVMLNDWLVLNLSSREVPTF